MYQKPSHPAARTDDLCVDGVLDSCLDTVASGPHQPGLDGFPGERLCSAFLVCKPGKTPDGVLPERLPFRAFSLGNILRQELCCGHQTAAHPGVDADLGGEKLLVPVDLDDVFQQRFLTALELPQCQTAAFRQGLPDDGPVLPVCTGNTARRNGRGGPACTESVYDCPIRQLLYVH